MADLVRNVAIVVFQYSVVVKGIERKMSEEYHVEIIQDFTLIRSIASRTDVFVIYLPEDIVGDSLMLEHLKRICRDLDEVGGKMVLIGESRFHRELEEYLPTIANRIWLDRPVEMDALKPAIEKAFAATGSGSKKRILIVDDDPSYAGMVREWIKDDYQADIVTAGMQAIKFLLKKSADLILLDYEMPVVDGPQVLQMLREEPETAGIPIIFLTGIGTKEAVQRVMALKPDGYVLKTTTRDDLLKYLKSKLG
ncbi:MAG: response regulator [Lachnospiraceae bacterium]|nr:response regulator [Lachnospiraceae bacterium]